MEENAAFASKEGFPFRLLCDTERQIGLAYKACEDPRAAYARRISYLIDEEGKIARAYDQVNPRSHPGEVLADLMEES